MPESVKELDTSVSNVWTFRVYELRIKNYELRIALPLQQKNDDEL